MTLVQPPADRKEALFLLPSVLQGQRGPVAAWLNTAGWAAAAERLGFRSTVVTPWGILDPDRLRSWASGPTMNSRKRSNAFVPTYLKTIVKDTRSLLRARAFARLAGGMPLSDHEFALVWQRHELFQFAGKILADRIECPLVMHVPAPKVWEGRSWGIRRPGWNSLAERYGDRRPLERADLIACVSEEVANQIAQWGIRSDKVLVTPSTVDTELFKPTSTIPEDQKRRSPSDSFVVGWTGSFRGFHGLDVLLDGAEEASKHLPNLVVMLVGDGPERSRLETEVERRGLSETVIFSDTVSHAKLPAVLEQFDAAVVTSQANVQFHYSPLKLWEYLAMARPVIAPAAGTPQRFLKHGESALLIPPGDATALAYAICKLAESSDFCSRLGQAGRQIAVRESWQGQFERIVAKLQL